MTQTEAYESIVKRIGELYKEVDHFQNISSVNRKHMTYAKKRIRLLERGVKWIEKGQWVKAEKIFEQEAKNHFNG